MGEFELLERVRERVGPAGGRLVAGIGDDASISLPAAATATSVDAVVEGVHFERSWASPHDIGHKALAAGLSDLAAMGAEPGEAHIVLGVPPDLDEEGCMELLEGALALAGETGTELAGGDLTRAPALLVSVTAVGHAPDPEALVRRSGARPGQTLVLTGEVGGAAAGLKLLADGGGVPGLEEPDRRALVERHLRPRPRIEAGRALAACGASAMIDLSDGLGADAAHIAAASGVGLTIDLAAVPLAGGIEAVAAGYDLDPEELAAGGGEDYELLAALDRSAFPAARERLGELGVRLTEVGEVAEPPAGRASAGEAGLTGEPGSGATLLPGAVELRRAAGGTLPASGWDQLA